MFVAALVVLGTLIVVVALWRWRTIRAMTVLSLKKRRLAPSGVVIGGESFILSRELRPAVLLLHGAGDTPQTLRYLGDYLHARGFHVEAPLLPGHGRRIQDFARVRADELTAAARMAYAELRSRHAWVGIIGLSMGG